MPLPTQRTQVQTDPSRYIMLIYGPTKSGKTTLASRFPGALFLSTEPGSQALSVYEQPIKSWGDFTSAAAELAAGRHNFKTVVIDTIDLAWKYCEEEFLKSIDKKIMPDDFGRSSTRMASIFHRELARLASLGLGVVMISHTSEKEKDGALGKVTSYSSSMPGACKRIVHGMTDVILFLELVPEIVNRVPTGGVVRRLRTRASMSYDAGERTGCMTDPLPCDYDALRADMLAALAKKAAQANASPSLAAPVSAPPSGANPTPPARPGAPMSRRRGQSQVQTPAPAPEPEEQTMTETTTDNATEKKD